MSLLSFHEYSNERNQIEPCKEIEIHILLDISILKQHKQCMQSSV